MHHCHACKALCGNQHSEVSKQRGNVAEERVMKLKLKVDPGDPPEKNAENVSDYNVDVQDDSGDVDESVAPNSSRDNKPTSACSYLLKKHPTKRCGICNKQVSRANVSRHAKTHKTKTNISSSACCVDAEKGIFLTQNTHAQGKPVHVKFKPYGLNQGIVCTHPDCHKVQQPATRGNQGYLCEHLSSVINIPSKVCTLELPALDTIMSPLMKQRCHDLQGQADLRGSPLVVKWPHSSCNFYYSVFSGTEKSWSPLERVLVTETNDSLFCPCVGSKHSCVHKGIIRWANGTSPLEKSKSSPSKKRPKGSE